VVSVGRRVADGFSGWLESPQPEALLNSSIFFDLRALYGQESLANELRRLAAREGVRVPHLPARDGREHDQLGVAAELVEGLPLRSTTRSFRTPSISRSTAHDPSSMQRRIYALARQIPDTNTVERLRVSGEKTGTAADALAALIDAFHHIQRLRLEQQVNNRRCNGIQPRESR
jgi:CBS domain-containing protein